MQYLKLYYDTQVKSGTKKWAAHDKMICVSESNQKLHPLLHHQKFIPNEHPNWYGAYLPNGYIQIIQYLRWQLLIFSLQEYT